jgi:hypothetical protein
MLYDGERIGRLARATEVLLGELRRLRDETESMLAEMESWPSPPAKSGDTDSSEPWLTLTDDEIAAGELLPRDVVTMVAPPSARDSRVPTHRPEAHAPLLAMAPPPFRDAKGARIATAATVAGAFAHVKSHRAARSRAR